MKRILNYIFKHKWLLAIPTFSMLLVIVVCLFEPYVQKLFIDKVITGGDRTLIPYLIGGIIVINIIKAVFGYIKEYLFDLLSAKVTKDLKEELFAHIQKLPFGYFDKMNTGELMSRIGEDIENIWRAIGFGLRLFVENSLYFVFSSVILLYLDWKLALACILIMLPIAYIAIKLESKIVDSYEKISDQNAVINTTAQENISGVRLVKAFGREKHEILKFLKMNRKNYKLNMDQAKITADYFPPIELLTNISLVIMIALGGILVINKEITLGTLVAFSGYIWNLIWPMRMLGWLINIIAQNNASANKIFKIMDIEPSIKDSSASVSLSKINGNIDFKDVSFKYGEEEVLNDINLRIPAGSTVAIMGTTGSGKTSIINLLGRYYDVSKGKVLIDGIDVKNIKLNDLRSNIAIVPQDVFLFSDTIEENIRFGNRNASDEQIIEAANLACASRFITKLPEGYNTVIGERGLGLSGGQKQRISIARALVRRAPIIILDDATSALDMETEFQLLKNLNSLNDKSTVFIIAHRISAVKNADIILFLENGEIVEKGTHHELIELKGKYYEIYKEQFKDFETITQEVIA
ncbi:ABC transporter ATP-binding protein [Clostridium sp. 'White wine YQ']|uniref:ABC transporter ATP-binding protein n=1 Tax=Clostridium sp. 'White wine YQ' TaxID=3027474 RepID=UPI00236735BC|nr:ABC transporter ATP-binding protein [Clostridium sp. 'White wine YQ']MDD7794998.1 ABC transporter ATP-binding protein [Clostridium sp. 'White wine YQ']